MSSQQQKNKKRVEKYLQQIQSSKDQRIPTSWHDFIDTVIVGSGLISSASISDLAGRKWASLGQDVSPEEVLVLVHAFTDPYNLYRNGIYIDGRKYCCLSAHSNVIVGRNAERSVTICRCKSCIIIGVHQHKVNPSMAHVLIQKLAVYLSEQGF